MVNYGNFLLPMSYKETLRTTEDSNVVLKPQSTVVVSDTHPSLAVSFETPIEGSDCIYGLIFKAGGNFSLLEETPDGFTVAWDSENTWTEGNIYEVLYRCLWLTDSNDNIVISAKVSEVSA